MAKTDFRSVDEYLATQPAAVRAVLERVRRAIHKALPDAEEGISYQIPAYRLHGGVVLYFAGWKKHVSIYPASPELAAAFAKELEPYELSKGTIRFPLAKPVPSELIGRIARFRAQESLARQGPKAARRTTAKAQKTPAKPAAGKR